MTVITPIKLINMTVNITVYGYKRYKPLVENREVKRGV